MKHLKKPLKCIIVMILILGISSFSLSAVAVNSIPTTSEAADDKTTFLQIINQQMIARNTSFFVNYTGELSDVYSDFSTLMDEVYAVSSHSSSGDYLESSLTRLSFLMPYTNATRILPFHFQFEYLTTAQEEQYVDTRVSAILDELQVYYASSYIKIRTVYDYICTHFKYDYSLTKFSAYQGLSTGEMVCQGYALLLFKMLAELEVPVRIVSGNSHLEPHAWNIAKIGSKWYNLDATWDAAYTQDGDASHDYFLKGSMDFPDHNRDKEYRTADYNLNHSMSSFSFSAADSVTIDPYPESETSVLSPGEVYTLTAAPYPKTNPPTGIVWSSSDESVAAVSSDGTVTAISGGSVVITATAADEGGAACCVSFTVVDFSQSSLWAQAELTRLYERGIIPVSLLVQFDANIARGEFTALLINLYEYASGQMNSPEKTSFTDISGHPFQSEIEYAYSLGIVNGKSSTRFAPDDPLTRQEGAKLICSLIAALDSSVQIGTSPLPPYPDADRIAGWAMPYVSYAFERDLMHGTGLKFLPLGTLTKEQAMCIVERLAKPLETPGTVDTVQPDAAA